MGVDTFVSSIEDVACGNDTHAKLHACLMAIRRIDFLIDRNRLDTIDSILVHPLQEDTPFIVPLAFVSSSYRVKDTLRNYKYARAQLVIRLLREGRTVHEVFDLMAGL